MVHRSDDGGYPGLLTDEQLQSSRQKIKAELLERHRAEMVERAAKHDQRALDKWIDWVLNRWVLETTGAAHQALYCSSWDQWIWLYPLPLPSVEFCHMVLGQLMTFDTPESAWEEAWRIDPLLWEKADRLGGWCLSRA